MSFDLHARSKASSILDRPESSGSRPQSVDSTMTSSQWVFYFAAELASVLPNCSLAKAMLFGRASRQLEQPEAAARDVAVLLAAAAQTLPRAPALGFPHSDHQELPTRLPCRSRARHRLVAGARRCEPRYLH